jgi:hypothetical protein
MCSSATHATLSQMLAMGRDSHHLAVLGRFAPDAPPSLRARIRWSKCSSIEDKSGTSAVWIVDCANKPSSRCSGSSSTLMGCRQTSMRGLDTAEASGRGDAGMERQALCRC